MADLMLNSVAAVKIVEAIDGRDLPQPVIDAWNYREAVHRIDPTAPDPVPVLAAASADEVAEVAADLARQRIVATELQLVRTEAINVADRRLVSTVIAGFSEIIEALGPRWQTAADTFTELHAKLPAGYRDPTVLVAAGPDAVATFAAASTAAAELDRLARIRNDLALLGAEARVNRSHEAGTRYTSVTDTLGAEDAAEAMKVRGPLDPWGSLLELEKVTGLAWRTVADHAAYVRALPVVTMRTVRTRRDGFIVHEQVPA